MAHTSKTLKSLVEKANHFMKVSADEQVSAREAIFSITASMLHEGHCYIGFNFIQWTETGFNAWLALGDENASKTPYIGDESRRYIYTR